MTVGPCDASTARAIVELSLFLEGPGPWPIPAAGPATAAPLPTLTAACALRESWPVPSTPTSADSGRNFLQGKGRFHGDQGPRPAAHPLNSACSR